MRADMGLFDRLFGEKAVVELPQPDGSVRKVKVSVRWLDEMARLGKIKAAGGQKNRAHILELDLTSRVEEWTVRQRGVGRVVRAPPRSRNQRRLCARRLSSRTFI